MPCTQQRWYLLNREKFTSTVDNNILDPRGVFKLLLVTAVYHKSFLWQLFAPERRSLRLQGNNQLLRNHVRDESCLKSQERGVSSRKGGKITAGRMPPAREAVLAPGAHVGVVVLALLSSMGLISTWQWGKRAEQLLLPVWDILSRTALTVGDFSPG